MGDDYTMGEFWRDVNEARQEKRASNREDSAAMLTEAGIKFQAKNMGAHLIVSALGHTFEFWPGTGLWMERGKTRRQYGVRRLIAACTPDGEQHA